VRAACSSALSRAASAQAEARGLILLSCGTRANVIRLLPPLTIPFEVLEEGLDLLEASIEGAIMETAAA
jgi:4-aminobutyrate aminotransferase/(S)-3-amino-2-methylpropionate transaminase